MKFIITILLILQSLTVLANKVDISLNPESPVMNEPFNVVFTVKTDSSEEPIIDFDPLGLEVLSRSNLQSSSQTTYINGKLSSSSIYTIAYEVMASNSGTAHLRNITVELGTKTIKHPTYNISILRTAKQQKKVFARIEVDKADVYVGESVIARYYLYIQSDLGMRNVDIKKFPKLDKFLKRFHQEQSGPQRVNIGGARYTRRVMYTAQIFAEKPGAFKLDPITLKVIYSNQRSNFGNFGFGLSLGGRSTSRTVISKPIEINVLPVPIEGMPKHFTGLVGHHKFELKTSKNKFISNEPIELELNIDGEGALELFEAPTLLDHENLEEFSKTDDLEVRRNFTAKKKVSYTYLGRGKVDLKKLIVPLSYFDPGKKEYVTVNLNIGDLKVAAIGGQNAVAEKRKETKKDKTENISKESDFNLIETIKPIVFQPILKLGNTFLYELKTIFIIFAVLSCSLFFLIGIKSFRKLERGELSYLDRIYLNGVSYDLFFLLLDVAENESMEQKIKKLDLDKDTQSYFFKLIQQLNDKYSKNEKQASITIKKKYFKKLDEALAHYGK